ncbi:DUF1800 domain-containing protein [Roseateles amylovorans]|uniref:DUF1800 domain-containing protein n=1 Tax=Roseateles amylovorans TaxID=2978473 RepID=A0ABY6B237_9BURK|nr:DUF1800 domain-containing protein [Roseateles amylovorans]UXH79273.1 DUF1800 domain-containing protein [Roseateles amylovorans]
MSRLTRLLSAASGRSSEAATPADAPASRDAAQHPRRRSSATLEATFASPGLSRRAVVGRAAGAALMSTLGGCGGLSTAPSTPLDAAQRQRAADRLGWGATQAQLAAIERAGWGRYVEQQLRADPKAPLAPAAQRQIDALDCSRRDLITRVREAEALRRTADKATDEAERVAARQAYQQAQNLAAREAGHRQLLRQLYSEQQLLEHLSWFWFNHFNVHQGKRDVRLLLADYEEQALRPQALGSFRRMLGAVARHPAMLRYLDNDQNGLRAINENYARELLELHTLGVDGGYSQRDVQELARVLTGFGVRIDPEPPKLGPKFIDQYHRDGFFEFNPARHDFGDKQLLGHTIRGRGLAELDEVLDLLVAQPATARFVSRKLAVFFLSDQPPPALVDTMARAFERSRGDIPATLRPLLFSPAFTATGDISAADGAAGPGVGSRSLAPKFKDPQHYLMSSLRAGFEHQAMLNSQPLQQWLRRLGQGLYDKQTPDGYPLTAEAWDSPGQMTLRFEIARQIGGGAPGLFRAEGTTTPVPMPDLQALRARVEPTLAPATRQALAQTGTPQQWLTLWLSSPDFMYR